MSSVVESHWCLQRCGLHCAADPARTRSCGMRRVTRTGRGRGCSRTTGWGIWGPLPLSARRGSNAEHRMNFQLAFYQCTDLISPTVESSSMPICTQNVESLPDHAGSVSPIRCKPFNRRRSQSPKPKISKKPDPRRQVSDHSLRTQCYSSKSFS